MNKKILLSLVCTTLVSTGISVVDASKEIAPMRLDMTRPYGGKDVSVTHEQVMKNLKELNNLVERSPGWSSTKMATVYKDYYESKDVVSETMRNTVPLIYRRGAIDAYASVGEAYKKKVAERFGMPEWAIDPVFEEITQAEKEGRAVNISKFDKNQKKLYEATTLSSHVRTAETDLINVLPKALEKGN